MRNNRMNEELTNETLEALGSCMNTCGDGCKARGVCLPGQSYVRRKLATALLEERAKPKVWDGAPEDAVSVVVTWCKSGEIVGSVSYNRELPKTRTREIAENIVHGINGKTHGETKDIEYVEGVLNKYAEELKGEA